MNLAEVSSPVAVMLALASLVSAISESSSLFFMHDVGKGSTEKLEWRSSREPFNFGSFGITDPPSNFNLKTEERKDEKVDLCCDRDAHGDSFAVSAIVKSDSDLANQVNRKVCELDFAQSHMCSTLLRINAIFERRNSRYGELRVLESEDCESIDKYVRALLQIDVQFKDSGSDQIQKEFLMASKKQLEGIVQKKLSAATDQRNVFLLRFYVFPPFSFQVLLFLVFQNQQRQAIHEFFHFLLNAPLVVAFDFSIAPDLFDHFSQKDSLHERYWYVQKLFDEMLKLAAHKVFDEMLEMAMQKLFTHEMPKRDVLNLLHKVCWPPISGVECLDGLYSFCQTHAGGPIGGLIPFILNYNRGDNVATVNNGTYIGFMAFMSLGTILSLIILPTSKVVCDDGTRCTNMLYSNVAEAGAIPILILHDETEELRDNAAEALANFYEDHFYFVELLSCFQVGIG